MKSEEDHSALAALPADRRHVQSRVYETLRQRITAGAYVAGERLTEARISQELDVSRTPVREAIQRLTAEGLVQFHPNRGATVSSIDGKDLEELFALRILLEGFAAGLAAQNATDEDVAGLRALQDRFAQIVDSGGSDQRARAARVNLELHEAILAVAASKRLSSMVRSLTDISLARSTFDSYSDKQLTRSASQHDQIIDAIEKKDRTLAEMAMRVHINGARYSMMRELRDGDAQPVREQVALTGSVSGSGSARRPRSKA